MATRRPAAAATRRAAAPATRKPAAPAPRKPTAPAAESRRLNDAQIAEVLQLLRKVDSVELKVTVPVGSHRATIRGLPLDPVEAQPRQVFFFDTPDLALNKAGVVVRARRIAGGRGDSVVKLRPVDPDQMPTELRENPEYNIEVDVLPGGFVCSGTLKGRMTGQEVRDAVGGKVPLRKLFNKAQRSYFAQHAPEGIDFDSLSVLGPTFVLKSTFNADISGRADPQRLVAEMWLYPDGSRILELSTKCAPSLAFQVAMEARSYLSDRGIVLASDQQTKTRTALDFFAKELRAEKRKAAAAQAPAEASAADK